MKYPIQLLPKKNYKKIDCDFNHLHLVRHIEPKNDDEIIDPETGNIKLTYIADVTRHISDYSTSLLGIFELKHIAIFLTAQGKKLYNADWSPNSEINSPIFNTHFQLNNSRKYFTIKISNINNKPVLFMIDGIEKKASCFVEHTPMKWNFWHYSIRWINDNSEYLHEQNEKLFDKPKQGWVRVLSSAARSMLVHYASTNEVDHQIIQKSCYKQPASNLFFQKISLFLSFIRIKK